MQTATSMLMSLDEPKKKRGRRNGSVNDERAEAVIERVAICKAKGEKVTVKDIAIKILEEDGMSQWKAKVESKTIANRVTKLLKKSQ